MSTSFPANSLTATIPALGDSANIITAFQDYHTSISDDVAVLARANTFTNTNTIDAANSLVFKDASNIEGRLIASSGILYLQAGSSSADTAAELRITRYSSASNISALKLYADNTTLYGTLNLVAGTASIAPIKLVSGTNLTNPIAGAIEYDGTLIYATPKVNNTTAGRGLVPAQNVLMINTTYVQSVSSSGSTITTEFYALNGKSIYLAANQNYFVELSIRVLHNITIGGGGLGSLIFGLKAPTNTGFFMDTQSQIDLASIGTVAVPDFAFITGLGATKTLKSSSSSDNGYAILKWSGIVQTGASAGNFGPTVTIASTASSGTTTTQMTVQTNSYCMVTPIGSSASEVNIGGWA
jgi:hypothetical protein